MKRSAKRRGTASAVETAINRSKSAPTVTWASLLRNLPATSHAPHFTGVAERDTGDRKREASRDGC